MQKDMWTKLIRAQAGNCPECNKPLDLYCRPINVKFYICESCNLEWTEEYYAGFVHGQHAPNIACTGLIAGDAESDSESSPAATCQ